MNVFQRQMVWDDQEGLPDSNSSLEMRQLKSAVIGFQHSAFSAGTLIGFLELLSDSNFSLEKKEDNVAFGFLRLPTFVRFCR